MTKKPAEYSAEELKELIVREVMGWHAVRKPFLESGDGLGLIDGECVFDLIPDLGWMANYLDERGYPYTAEDLKAADEAREVILRKHKAA